MRAVEQKKTTFNSGNINQSGLVHDGQHGIHPRLEEVVKRHLDSHWKQPFHTPSVESYQRLIDEVSFTSGQAFILDSGCGTGKSTQQLAKQYADHLVIGVDRSQVRLAKSGVEQALLQRGNCVLVRADLPTFWRLLLRDGHMPEKHYLFYPNPWPKSAHLKRRWHGHPVFPDLLALGGEIELRCNWEIYALEFAQAVRIATGAPVVVKALQPQASVSPFEQKYMDRAQRLFSVTVPRGVSTLPR